ncbi:MAG: hypothetical protein KDE00_13090 [Rhodobacteraceae bacterium]|nr:hypothetical protein [Paracoccaceae bacterium]
MKLAAAILSKLSRQKDDQQDAFELRLQSMGAQKAQKIVKARRATPTLFVRGGAHA